MLTYLLTRKTDLDAVRTLNEMSFIDFESDMCNEMLPLFAKIEDPDGMWDITAATLHPMFKDPTTMSFGTRRYMPTLAAESEYAFKSEPPEETGSWAEFEWYACEYLLARSQQSSMFARHWMSRLCDVMQEVAILEGWKPPGSEMEEDMGKKRKQKRQAIAEKTPPLPVKKPEDLPLPTVLSPSDKHTGPAKLLTIETP